MDYQILVEKQPNDSFIATALGWPDCVSEGETKDEAVGKVRAAVAERLARGEIVRVQGEATQTTESADPWERMFGRDANDPHWDEFQEELRRIREEANRVYTRRGHKLSFFNTKDQRVKGSRKINQVKPLTL